MPRAWALLLLLVCATQQAAAEPGSVRRVLAVREVASLPTGLLLQADLSPDADRSSERAGPFLLRITMPHDGEVRLEAGHAEVLDSRPVPAPPPGAVRITRTGETITITRAGVEVAFGRAPFTLDIKGRAARIGFGDTSVGYVIQARWDTATGKLFDAWLSLNVPSTTVFYGGFPAATRLRNLYANGSDVSFYGPGLLNQPTPGTNPPPPRPLAPVFVTNTGWAMRFPPLHTVSVNLTGRGEIGMLQSALDITFVVAPGLRPSAAMPTTPPDELLAAALRDAWVPPSPSGVALDPAISRDSQMNEQFLGALYIRARALDIPVNILLMEEWLTSPELAFRRAVPRPGDTFGLAALTAVTETPQVHRLVWTGSLAEDFASLRITLRAALTAALSGLPAVGYDLHALLGRTGEEEEHPSPDLFRRWTQFLAFSPVMQIHGRRFTHEPWLYSDPGIVSQFRDYAWLHVNLKPYLEAASASATPGRAMMRPPVMAWPRDTETWNIDDAYLLGDDLYVAPVLDPARTARPIYLPPGRWFDLWSEGAYAGGRWLAAYPAPPDAIPVFVRAGALLPLALDHTYTPGQPIRDTPNLTLRFYPDPSGGAGGSIRRGRTSLAALLVAGPGRGSRTVRLAQTKEPVTLWLPETLTAPRRVTSGGRTLARKFSWEAIAEGEGWVWDSDLQRLLVRIRPGPARSITVSR